MLLHLTIMIWRQNLPWKNFVEKHIIGREKTHIGSVPSQKVNKIAIFYPQLPG
jgi:hypothetical protein